jgi:ABC-type glycerol-3-phosphate transport system substrate-binding protein
MDHWIATEGLEYQGRPWLMPWYQISIVWLYNKSLFKKAGLDPNRPPETWDEFIEDCKALKRAGITAVSQGGLKDAWGVDWLYSLFAPAAHNNTREFIDAATRPGSFKKESHKDWLRKLQFLYENGYTDPNAMSLDFFQGRELFHQGKAGFGVATNGQAIQWIEDMGGDEVVDIMKVPVMGNGKLAGKINNQSHSFCIPSFAKHKREAADFLIFMHQPEQLSRWYQITRNIPCDDRFDTSVLSTQVEKKFYDYLVSDPCLFPGIYIPVMVDVEGSYAAGQLIFSGGSVDEAAQLIEDVAEKWRKTDPEGLEQFIEWAKEYD